jgi:site-specific DNA recombinase
MKAVAYARFSTDRQREESITAQLRAIHEYALKNNIHVVREYLDEGRSATTDDRPAFQQMFSDLEEVRPNLVLVHKLDRFARDRFDSAYYRREIQKAGARLVAVDQPLDDSPESAFLEGILEAQAEFYSRNLAREVMKGMKENAFKAKFNGGRAPLGYDIDSEGHYVINEDEATTVRLIFQMKLTGKSLNSIVDELSCQGRRTKAGKPFGKNSIDAILRNERYSGTYVFNEIPKKIAGKRNNRVKNPEDKIIRVEGAIPAIIGREDWVAVREMMEACKHGPRRRSDTLYILTGLLKCGECGAAMVGNTATKTVNGSIKKYHYYECSRAKRTGTCANKKRYPQEKLEQSVLKFIESQLIRPENRDAMVDRLWEAIRMINDSSETECANMAKQLQTVKEQMDRVVDSIKKGLPFEHMSSYFAELGEQKKYLEAQLGNRQSIFTDVTRQDVHNYMKRQQGRLVTTASAETRKDIVTSYVKEATVLGKSIDIVLKLQLGSLDKAGVGGGT